MAVLALDIGTTSWKAGIYGEAGQELAVCRVRAPAGTDGGGNAFYAPEDMAASLRALMGALPISHREGVQYIALAGMAEAGLLTDKATGQALSPILPWHDTRGLPVFHSLQKEPFIKNRQGVTGLPNSVKYGIYKLLALKAQTGRPAEDLRWLGIVEYAAWLLTGEAATEPTLAARTWAYDIIQKAWDLDFLRRLDLPETVFPPVVPSGAPIGALKKEWAAEFGIPPDATVCICGHDHLCAAFGARALTPGRLFCSMGTAQVLLAMKGTAGLNEADTATGLSFGPAFDGGLAVLGSIQSAGGSVTLINRLLYNEPGYDALMREAAGMPEGPSGLVYLPYLAGSGAPHLNRQARGGFLNLSPDTTRGQLLLGVYEGIAFESKLILEAFGLEDITEMAACGGLAGHTRLMQTMADILRLPVRVLATEEGTLYGAAGLAFLNAGISLPGPPVKATFSPRPEHARGYESIYRKSYLPLQQALLDYYATIQE